MNLRRFRIFGLLSLCLGLANKAARKLAKNRDKLAELLPGLDAESRFARDLQRLLERWPDRQAFRDDLIPESKAFELGRALAGLKFQAPDTRPRWTTPFPLFRP